MGERAHDRIGREAAERAQRAELHGVAEVFQDRQVRGPVIAADDAIDRLDPSGRTDAARRALAAGFERAEFHRKARLLCHVDGVVEHHDAAMADQAVTGRESLVVERRIEQRAGEIGPERSPTWTARTGRPLAVPPPMSSTSSPSVMPKAVSY